MSETEKKAKVNDPSNCLHCAISEAIQKFYDKQAPDGLAAIAALTECLSNVVDHAHTPVLRESAKQFVRDSQEAWFLSSETGIVTDVEYKGGKLN